jgi:plasmid stabilization system protein ParE
MSLPIVFRRAARREFDDAADWYEQRQAGLGEAFTEAIQHVLDRVATQPNFYPQVYHDVREAMAASYPYCIYYRVEPNQVVVLSVFHTARNPSIWQERV